MLLEIFPLFRLLVFFLSTFSSFLFYRIFIPFEWSCWKKIFFRQGNVVVVVVCAISVCAQSIAQLVVRYDNQNSYKRVEYFQFSMHFPFTTFYRCRKTWNERKIYNGFTSAFAWFVCLFALVALHICSFTKFPSNIPLSHGHSSIQFIGSTLRFSRFKNSFIHSTIGRYEMKWIGLLKYNYNFKSIFFFFQLNRRARDMNHFDLVYDGLSTCHYLFSYKSTLSSYSTALMMKRYIIIH